MEIKKKNCTTCKYYNADFQLCFVEEKKHKIE